MKTVQYLLDKRLTTGAAATALLAIAWLFYYPVISAGVLFQDDAERVTTEVSGHGFIEGGRFVSEFLSMLMTGLNEYPVDYGSLGQVLGATSIVTAVFLLLRFKLDFSVRSIIAVSPLIINPFLLHNVSYRFDSFGMLLGYGLAITAFALFQATPWRLGICTFLLFISFGLYQSMPSVFLMLIALEFIAVVTQAKENIATSIKALVIRGLSYAAALILYLLTTAYIFPLTNTRNQASLSIESMPDNISRVIELLASYYEGPLLVMTMLSLAISLVILFVYTYNKRQKSIRVVSLLIGTLLLLSTLLGPMLITENAIVFPRSLSAVALFTLIPGVALLLIRKKSPVIQGVLTGSILLISMQAMLFSYSYGAFLSHQSDYQRLLLQSTYSSIQAHELEGTLYVVGHSDQPVASRKIMERYPILVENYWKAAALNNPSWTERLLKNYGVNTKVDWVDEYPDKQEVICSAQMQPAITTRSYLIYTVPDSSEASSEHVIFFRPNQKDRYCS